MRYEYNMTTGVTVELPDLPPIDLTPEGQEAERVRGVQAQISAIEAGISPRRIREAMLSPEGAQWLASKDAEINVLRESIKTT